MVIWLRNPQTEGASLGVGVEGDVLRHERLATIVDIDAGYAGMQRQCDAALEAARAEADALLDDARSKAGELVARAEEDYASAAQRGYDDGFQRGLTDWHARAVDAHVDASTLERNARDRLAELVVLAVEQIVASEDRRALFARAAATVERIVADGSPVHLRVHPDEVAAASGAFEAVASAWRDAGRSVRLHVSADATLAAGACVAETDLGAVDASLSLHLAAMRGALARAVQSVAGDALADAGSRDESGNDSDAPNEQADDMPESLEALLDGDEGESTGEAVEFDTVAT